MSIVAPPLWAHQKEAIGAVTGALRGGERTTAVLACGTGKTRVGSETAGLVAPSEPVLFVVPTLDLLAQTLGAWQDASGRQALGRVIAVCSDQDVMDRETAADLAALEVSVTTDPGTLATLLKGQGRLTAGITYQSLPSLVAAHRDYGAPGWRFAVVDEAHRSAGARDRSWSAIHDNVQVPVDRRLYMTATPRIVAGHGDGDSTVVSMDDEKIFGRVSYRLPYARARALGLLADYRVIVAIATDAEVRRLALAQGSTPEVFGVGRTATSAPMLAKQLAVLRAMREFGVSRMLTYHHRVQDAQWFARTLPGVDALLGRQAESGELVTDCVYGQQPGRQRRKVLGRLRSPGTERVVISNARVLSEGVDAPAVDGVAFIDARASAIDTVQALGRAMRLGGKADKTASVIIPVLLEPGQDPATALESSAYATVWRVTQALRAHDDELAEYFDRQRAELGRTGSGPGTAGELPSWLHFSGAPVPRSFTDAISVRVVRGSSAAWEEYFGAARAWREQHGDLRSLSVTTTTASGLRIGEWIVRQRQLAGQGRLLPDRRHRLDELGMLWDRREAAWQRYLTAAEAYHREHGSLRMPTDYRPPGDDPVPLGEYLARVRTGDNKITEGQKAALDRLGMVWTRHSDESWDRALAAARTYREREGDLLVPKSHVTTDTPPIQLGQWFNNLRARRASLTNTQIQQLEDLDMVWDVNAHLWQRHLDAATDYYNNNGHLRVPQKYRTPEPASLGLGTWIATQRRRYAKGSLTEKQVKALTTIGMMWSVHPARGRRTRRN
ncbi:Helicase associated domain protein [Streptomyces sp. NPDC055078]